MSKEYCEMCCDAVVRSDLHDDNDYSAFTLDCSEKSHRLMMRSGWGRAPRLEAELWSELCNRWITLLAYYPNFCPNCGRKIDGSKYRFPIEKD